MSLEDKYLPIGVQNFRTLIERNQIYIDKTRYIYSLIQSGSGGYFLSRPRRFGKSLLVSTFAALFSGDKNLFRETWISSSDYQWPKHPVLFLDFSGLPVGSKKEFEGALMRYLLRVADSLDITINEALINQFSPGEVLTLLVQKLSTEGKVVLLVDEYDAPLIEAINDMQLFEEVRNLLRQLFLVAKKESEHIHFLFLTGVTKFSKVSLFSGLNSLEDLSLDSDYAALAGITEEEIQTYLGGFVEQSSQNMGLEKKEFLDLLRHWYNGYLFGRKEGTPRVFNPWSLLNCLKKREIGNYWFSTGTPRFAFDLLRQQRIDIGQFKGTIEASRQIEECHEGDFFNPIPLLFQTGYLTIDSYNSSKASYLLRFPNEEVRTSFFGHLFSHFYPVSEAKYQSIFHQMATALEEEDLPLFFSGFNQVLANIPYPIHETSESYYHSLMFLSLYMLQQKVEAESLTNKGRIDLVVQTDKRIYLFELKVDRSAQHALDQVKAKEYALKLLPEGKPVTLVGVNVDTQERSVTEWKEELC